MHEIELKFLVDKAAVTRLRRNPVLKAIAEGAPRTARLLTVYYDTTNAALAAEGMALRLRREGRTWTQTVKGARRQQGGVSSATEIDTPAPGGRIQIDAIPDEDLKAKINGAVNGHALNPVFSTDIKRTSWLVSLPDGQAEIALDIGEIIAGERQATLQEVEIELKAGHPRALFEVARQLFPRGGLRFSHLNKARRGRMLVEHGRAVDDPAPRNAIKIRLDPTATVEIAARDILGECLEQVADNMTALCQTEDPEAAHQLRVGLRRLRSAFGLFAPMLSGAAFECMKEEAKWLGQEVGRLRDLEVARDDILAPERGKYPDEIGFVQLDAALGEAIEAERLRLRALLIEERAQKFVLDLAEFVATRGWLDPTDVSQSVRLARPIGEYATSALDKVYKKAVKKARTIEKLTIDERHELRKELKKLRYTVEFLSPLFENQVVPAYIKALKKLQTILGELNDAAMTEAMFSGEAAPAADQPAAARAAGRLIGARLERADHAWQDAHARWEAFVAVGPFWRPSKR